MIRVEQLCKTYLTKQGPLYALQDINLTIGLGEFVVVRGPSGCGKSTLLLILGGMLRPSAGEIWMRDRSLYSLSRAERARFRATEVGFVFQMFHLVPYLTILENVKLPLHPGTTTEPGKAQQLLMDLGLGDRLTHRPAELSAGEKQRVALARAMINQPSLILADEPTGNLDPQHAADVLAHLRAYQRQGGTVVMVTHGVQADAMADRIIPMNQGRLTP
ncbi:MAG: ABC transporter ATP-binding protein [bacterium]|nr:ABC transporter ATP-binding protein [bacterium]